MHRTFAQQIVELLFQIPGMRLIFHVLGGSGLKGIRSGMSARLAFFASISLRFFLHRAAHQYLRGRATPAGDGKLYSTTSTPLAVSFANQVSVPSPSSSSRPRSRR